jgi:hypothetical protein
MSPDADVDEARQLMAQHQLDRILVVEDGNLVGIISEADIRADEGPLALMPTKGYPLAVTGWSAAVSALPWLAALQRQPVDRLQLELAG